MKHLLLATLLTAGCGIFLPSDVPKKPTPFLDNRTYWAVVYMTPSVDDERSFRLHHDRIEAPDIPWAIKTLMKKDHALTDPAWVIEVKRAEK